MKQIKDLLPETIKRPLRLIRTKLVHLYEYPIILSQPERHKKALEKVCMKDKVKVAFFALSSSVWKYEGIYWLMEQDPRFEPIVIVCPIVNYGYKNMLVEMENAFKMFQDKGYNVIRTYDETSDSYLDVKKEIDPDIIFYTNPHLGLIKDEYYIKNYLDTLTCYTQYSFHVTYLNQAQYNQLFHNVLWKAFYETKIHAKMAKHYSRNKGKNVIISGYPGIDDFVYGHRSSNNEVWKSPDAKLKRIIWAPHHTIDLSENLGLSNFLLHYQFILDIAEKYKDKIQIAFKPHPLLKVKLSNYKDWGAQRTENYYKTWDELENGQLEIDDYVDLFNTSDAMILDSCSFVAEYLCCGKPSLFTFKDSSIINKFNEFGRLALNHHYHAFNESQIIEFIENVVCNGNDIKLETRKEFYDDYLVPPHNKNASENIYNEICNIIWNETS